MIVTAYCIIIMFAILILCSNDYYKHVCHAMLFISSHMILLSW